MSNAAIASPESITINLACFSAGGQIYALEVAHVREIVRLMEITPLPNAPGLIEGVIDLRGAVIPVLDLAHVLGAGRAEASVNSRIVVLESDGLVFGLWVDAATDVLTIGVDRLEDVPELAAHAGYDSIRHVVRRAEAAPAMVLSLEALIETVYRSAVPAAPSQRQEQGGAE